MKLPKLSKSAIAAISVILLIGMACAALTLVQIISMDGTITTEAGIEVNKPSISWGVIAPDSSNQDSFMVTNVGNAPVDVSFETSTLPNGLSLDFQMENGNSLGVGESKNVVVTLIVAPNAPAGDFGFDVTVRGTP